MTDDAAERFELLYRRHFRAVLRYALARLDAESAKDATAETCLIAWRRLPDVPRDPAPWLFAVARKVIAGQYRSRTRREALRGRLELAVSGQPGPGEVGEEVAERATVLAAFAGLGENDREVLRLIAWDGLPVKVAAEVLGVTRFAFGVRLHRARQRLSAAIEAAEAASRSSPAAGGRGHDATARAPHQHVSLAPTKEAR
jgi:RNA polymerase sigma-70 factor (ECF subfamily)